MNRKLISLAVAAALVAPAAAMADAVLYGKMNVSLDYVDVTNVILPVFNDTNVVQNVGYSVYPANWPNVSLRGQPIPNPLTGVVNTSQVNPAAPNSTRPVNPGGQVVAGTDFQGWGMANGYVPNAVTYVFVPAGTGVGGVFGQLNPGSGAVLTAAGMPAPLVVASQGGGRANRVGVKGSEDLGGGLKAIYQIELGINPTDTNNNLVNNADTISMRNTFVGLAGGFGTVLMGRHDTPLKISTGKLDFFADTLADMNATVGFHDLRADNAVAYISPSFSGFTLAAAIVPAGGGTALGTTNTQSDNINEGWSIAASTATAHSMPLRPTSRLATSCSTPTSTTLAARPTLGSAPHPAMTGTSGASASACSTGTASACPPSMRTRLASPAPMPSCRGRHSTRTVATWATAGSCPLARTAWNSGRSRPATPSATSC